MTTQKNNNSSLLSNNYTSCSLVGWGRYPRITGQVISPDSAVALQACFEENVNEGILARGLGRSYGDAALSESSRILLTGKLKGVISFDNSTGTLCCEPGLSFQDIISTFLPRGWFAPVTPGTKYVSMGGALASDIHGKNHHQDGSFVDFVSSFKLLLADGQTLWCSRQENSDLFWATAGGMGLTGFICELVMSLRQVESRYMVVKRLPCSGLSETFKMIESHEKDYQYSVSWIDCLSTGKSLGRSILILGRHAGGGELNSQAQSLFRDEPKPVLKVPVDMPSWILNRYSIGAFNWLYYHLSARDSREKIMPLESFFYPLDSIADWNRMYGAAGFIQYQCVLPLSSSQAGLEEILTLSGRQGRSSFLAVLKKFGKGHGLISFPMDGYTLALDLPVKPGFIEFTRELDRLVVKYGGRVYLAKDACLNPQTLRAMYRDLPKWLQLKKEVDQDNRFNSALSKRLKLW